MLWIWGVGVLAKSVKTAAIDNNKYTQRHVPTCTDKNRRAHVFYIEGKLMF